MNRIRKYGGWILRQKEWIHILASVATILSLFTALYLFNAELAKQKEETRQDRLAHLAALRTELDRCVKTIDQYNGLKGAQLTMVYFRYFQLENLRHSITRGWLMSEDHGPKLLLLYEKLVEENFMFEIENSPGYVLTSPDNWPQRKQKAMESRRPRFQKIRDQIVEVNSILKNVIDTMHKE